MFIHNTVGDGKPKARALPSTVAREKRLKNVLSHFFCHPATIVLNSDFHRLIGTAPDVDANRAAGINAVQAVRDQVEHNLFHFLKLRMDHHAQWEIQAYGRVMAMMARKVAPMAYKSFENHILKGIQLSKKEQKALKAIMAGEENPLKGLLRQEFEEKLSSVLKIKSAGE